MKINKKYLEELLKEHRALKQYCIDKEDLLSFMLDYIIRDMQYDFNINVDKNKLIIESEDKDNE